MYTSCKEEEGGGERTYRFIELQKFFYRPVEKEEGTLLVAELKFNYHVRKKELLPNSQGNKKEEL